jgi:WhiB family transcriptional regulator, redox-sensing transcriptional regulator
VAEPLIPPTVSAAGNLGEGLTQLRAASMSIRPEEHSFSTTSAGRAPFLQEKATMARNDILWQKSGHCHGTDSRLFFPGRGESAAEAKAICRECPVRRACLDYAVAHAELWGVWGGTTLAERRNMHAERQPRSAAGTFADAP